MLPAGGPYDVGAFAYLVKGCSTQLMRDVILQAWKQGVKRRWTGPRAPVAKSTSQLARW